MTGQSLPCLAIAFLGTLMLASFAWAVKPFQDQFYALYLDEQSADAEVVAYVKAVRSAKCNLCHLGNRKKDRNTYGMELAKLLDDSTDKHDVEKIRSALQKVAALHSIPSDEGSMTFGQLIAARQLPGAEPEAAISLLDTVARSDEPVREAFSLHAAVTFLDNAALTWHEDRKCFALES